MGERERAFENALFTDRECVRVLFRTLGLGGWMGGGGERERAREREREREGSVCIHTEENTTVYKVGLLERIDHLKSPRGQIALAFQVHITKLMRGRLEHTLRLCILENFLVLGPFDQSNFDLTVITFPKFLVLS